MTAVSGPVIALIVLAVIVFAIFAIAATGRIRLSMPPVPEPWWTLWQRRRAERAAAQQTARIDALGEALDPRSDSAEGPRAARGRRARRRGTRV